MHPDFNPGFVVDFNFSEAQNFVEKLKIFQGTGHIK